MSVGSDELSYNPGERVYLDLLISDIFDNQIYGCYVYSSEASISHRDSVIQISEDEDYLSAITASSEPDASIFPTLTITDPDGTVFFEGSSGQFFFGYDFPLPPDAKIGTWTICLSFDTGPHQGIIEVCNTFTVGPTATVKVNSGNTINLIPGGSQSGIPLDINGIPAGISHINSK